MRGPLDRVVSRVDAKGKITPVGKENGTTLLICAPDMSYYTMVYNDVTTPSVFTLCTSAGKQLRVLEDNREYLSRYGSLPVKEFFTINSDGYTLNASILKPADFNPSRKYPVIMSAIQWTWIAGGA